MPKKGGSYVTMTEQMRIDLCNKKNREPWQSHKELMSWLEDEHGIKVTQGTISNTLKRSVALLDKDENSTNLSNKHQKTVRYPMMEQALAQWFVVHQEKATMTGDLIIEKGQRFLDELYPNHDPFVFSNGWLASFKLRHKIQSFRQFGESGSVDTELLAQSLPEIRKKLDTYELNNIYNMDETGLFYRMQVNSFKHAHLILKILA
ncbi:hypothetical protein FRX31_015360 [Thalictrum thalictroides]|uniref:HTH CENPB-type domain-containing protein n=1 Tax=Thalictrum thalictroides TaxID=46969 RepID=A0A7J6WC94_THATH|nr:hypothetical protein FRX31_015360 [Thalictrum thalictroides]